MQEWSRVTRKILSRALNLLHTDTARAGPPLRVLASVYLRKMGSIAPGTKPILY